MKQKVLLLLALALGMCSIKGSAQGKFHHIEQDGFEWYETYSSINGQLVQGAEDKFGNTIIPKQSIMISYKDGYFNISPIGTNNLYNNGLVDKNGYLIVPMEYRGVGYVEAGKLDFDHYLGITCNVPYIGASSNNGSYAVVYDLYGRCLIPVSRKYPTFKVEGRGEGDNMYWCCGQQDSCFSKYSLCDASGNEFFTTSKYYSDCVLIKHPSSKKFALAVKTPQKGPYHWCFVDKNEKILFDPYDTDLSKWPIEIRTAPGRPSRKLTVTEENKIFFPADWLDGNAEYFAHAAEYPMYKIGQNGMANRSNSGTGNQQLGQQQSGGTTTVVVEHHRDPVPVQEWQQCPACFGSGQCPNVQCGGSGWYYIGDRRSLCTRCHGSGKCTICAGRGGQNVTVYR